jgi:ribosomal protein S18 acetylase RimI-like enzyme
VIPAFETRLPGPLIARATPGDVDSLAGYVARCNGDLERQCLHTPGNRERVIREALWREGGLAEGSASHFVLALSPGGIVGALGCVVEPEGEIGRLWGPWVEPPEGWRTVAPALLAELREILPAGTSRLDAFLNIANVEGLAYLRRRGFSIRPSTHIYVAPVTAAPEGLSDPFPELAARHEVGFARLHHEMFPAADSTPAVELLAGRDAEHVIFGAGDGLRLLGYVCVSVNSAPREGFIDYLAVRPSARRRGIGESLLRTALHWAFADRHLPQAALCVTEWREDARRLYERAGFRQSATGRGARLSLR